MVGANGGSTKVPGEKITFFFKVVPGPLGMLKQVFLGRVDPVAECRETGPFCDQKRVKNGSKMCFSKSDPGPYGMLKQVFLAHSEPEITRFGPCKIPKCLEKGPLWDQKWIKTG